MKKNSFLLMFAVYAAFFALGLPDGAFGVAWPGIRYEMGLPLERAALLTATNSIFYSLAAWQTGRLAARFRVENLNGLGILLMLAGILGFSFAPDIRWLTAAAVVLGTGMGTVDSGVNAFAAKNFSARHMSWLHCFWGLGGAISPIIVSQMMLYYDWRAGYHAVFAIQAAIGVFVLVSIAAGIWRVPEREKENSAENFSQKKFLKARRFQVLQWLIFLLYVAFEYAVTFWTVSVLLESRGLEIDVAALYPAVYLGFMVAGRFASGYLTAYVRGSNLIRLGLAVSAAGLCVMIFTNNIAGMALIGLGFAPVFPCLMHETKRRFDPALLPKLVGMQVAAAGAGAALCAPVMGWILAEISLEALFPTVIALVAVTFFMNEIIEIKLKAVRK